MSGPVKAAASIVFISLLGIPAAYIVNAAQTAQGELGLFVAGTGCLVAISALTYVALSGFKQPKDWLFYVFTLSMFSSVVDILLALEGDGYISGFMTNYLKDGEPYLGTPYGLAICYWDGTMHFALYLYMLTAMACRWSYRSAGLYWVGSIGHSMTVLVPGAVLSKQGVRWSFFLNIPYIIIPIVSAVRFLRQRDSPPDHAGIPVLRRNGWLSDLVHRPVDLLFILAMISSIFVAALRGLATLGCSSALTSHYIDQVEPYLHDPVAFPLAQMLVYMYYFIPFYAMVIYSLLVPGCRSMVDWSLIYAGAAAQAQTSHIVSSLHSRTPAQYRVPPDALMTFILINFVLLLLVPQLFALRCRTSPGFFYQQTSKDLASEDPQSEGLGEPRRTKSQ